MIKDKKQLITTITLLLTLTMTLFMVNIQSVKAFDSEWETFAFVMVSPNPVGVDQSVLITLQIDKVNPMSTIRANLWEGLTCKITKPDGTSENKGPYTAYSMGNAFLSYTPTQVGTYKLEMNFPGQWANGSYTSISGSFGSWDNQTGLPLIYENRWYTPSSATVDFTVQEDPIQAIPDVPLPTEPWRRPISAENKGWYQVADNWLMMNYDRTARTFSMTSFAPYTSAPDSPHILWKQPVTFGGIVGGEFGDQTYRTGLSYEDFYIPLIVNGRIIYADHGPSSFVGFFAGPALSQDVFGTRCIDLYTGEEIWYVEDTYLAWAQTLQFDSGNEHGSLTYLWSISGFYPYQTWTMWDAFSGEKVVTIENVTAGTTVFGSRGELLSYSLNTYSNRLTLWNSTLAITGPGPIDYFSPMVGSVIDGNRGVQWSVAIPDVPGSQVIDWIGEDVIIAETIDASQFPISINHVAYPMTLQTDSNGNYPTSINHLWYKERKNLFTHWPVNSGNIDSGVYAMWDEAKTQIHGYDITTGNELWITEPLPMGWGLFSGGLHLAYGKAYLGTYDGHLRAYDISDGSLVWDWNSGSAGFENAYGAWPVYSFTIADGQLFVSNDEHSPDSVQWRGAKLWAVDAETGEGLWNVTGRLRHQTISDGILTAFNTYDNQIYTFGKGPSKTTVTASPKVSVHGSTLVIEGTVTDQTPASIDTPAISDEDMGDWMAYLHMQTAMPSDVTGVEVSLDAVDPNGNYVHIGTATSDMSGFYSHVVTPDVPGKYTIIATFAGSNSYGSSYAETAINVEEAPQATPPPETTPAPMTDTYLAGSTVAILAGIAIAVFLILRKK